MQRTPSEHPFFLRVLACGIACLVAILTLNASGVAMETELSGHWEGMIDVPNQPLQIAVDFENSASGWSATIDIPMQGAKGLPLEIISVTSSKVQFRIQGVPGDPTFDGTLEPGQLSGTFTQGGAELTFHLGREAMEKPKRPQEPTGPFPYTEEEASYKNDGIQLAGTLTLPPGEGPHPAVLLISGSGSQNRDSELMGHKPFWILADHLTRAGIAVLRVDDRGVGGSTGKVSQATSADFAQDVLAGVRWLKRHPKIAPDRIGLVGHSEGGLIAPIAASRSKDVAFIVLLAGPGVPALELLALQNTLLLRAQDVPEDRIREIVAANHEVLKILAQKEPDEEALRRLVGAAVKVEADPESSPEQLEALIDTELKRMNNPWFRFFLNYDPAVPLRQVTVPALALNGSLDLQVDAEQNLPKIAAALKQAGNEDFTVEKLDGLNHLFQPATTGAVSEYGQIEMTFAPRALDRVTSWILERFATPRS